MKKTFGIFGTGYLSSIVASAWKNGLLEDWDLVGVYGRNEKNNEVYAREFGVKVCSTIDELIALKPDYITEAASVAGMKECAEKIVGAGINMVIISIGSFADRDFLGRVRKTARENGAQVVCASGAVGGFDILRTLSLMGIKEFSFKGQKHPARLLGTAIENDHMMTDTEPSAAFHGTATEAIKILPHQVNVAVASALASVGPDNTDMTIETVPGFVGDEYTLKTSTPDGKNWTEIEIYSANSDIAGWSIVAAMRNITDPVAFF